MKDMFNFLKFALISLVIMAFIKPSQTFSQERLFLLDSTKAYVASASSDNDELALEDEVTILVNNWLTLLENDPDRSGKLLLYINDIPVKNVEPVSYIIDSLQLGLRYFIIHEQGTDAIWEKLLLTREEGQFFKTKVKLSVGYENQLPFQTLVKEGNSFTVDLVGKNWFYVSIFTLVILLIILIIISMKSDLLRDTTPLPPDGKRRPFSLARTQMALWFFVIMTSWLLLYVLKHSLDTIPDSMVVLMGISAGTGIGALALDRRSNGQIRTTNGFLNDLLEDENGISFHRFQMLCWTIVLVMVFVRQVILYLAMPEFSTSLLVLMGISSGTYLGFKSGEQQKGEMKEKSNPPA